MFKVKGSIERDFSITEKEAKKLVLGYLSEKFKLPYNEFLHINKDDKIYYTRSCYHNDTENIIGRPASELDLNIIAVVNHILRNF